jgi:tetratricopeptide (TPR) repeat protein
MDSTLERHVRNASEAFREGQIERSTSEYRRALHRAWAMDDPYESGAGAYNLAASLLSASQTDQAKDWLLDARVEFQRAGSSAGNVWLLEAKIAQQESRLDDVTYLIQRASCSAPPCSAGADRSPCDDESCCERCVAKIPVLGAKVQAKHATRDCEESYKVQIHLARARLAAEQYDIGVAEAELACACRLASELCIDDLHAELHDVAALVHIAKGEFLQAGRHLDREAESLRWAGNFREIPGVLELSAAAYEQSGMLSLAADRFGRAARVYCGRGDYKRAWRAVQQASALADSAGADEFCDTSLGILLVSAEVTKVRLALVANEIQLALADSDEDASEVAPLEDLEMLAPSYNQNE